MGERTVRLKANTVSGIRRQTRLSTSRFQIPLPNDVSTPLGVVRTMLADYTGLPRDHFKMLFSGAVMKDDSAPISAYQLKPSSTIQIIGVADHSGINPSPQSGSMTETAAASAGALKKQAIGPATQQGTLATIQAELDAVNKTIKPSVAEFLSTLPSSAPPHESRLKHHQLGELLLQCLLRLDAILPESDWADVRLARKGAVKEVQSLLDELDDAWMASSTAPAPTS